MFRMNVGLDVRLFVALVIGVFMGALDLTIVAPALPSIAGGLGVTPGAVVLAFSIYGAFYAVSVPMMSKLADVWGHARIYRFSLLIFAGGSLIAAVSPSLLVLILARVVQGVGGGGLFPVAQSIIGDRLPEERRGKILGVLLGVFAAGGVLGPNLGGFLTQVASWRWIFWINVPLGILGILLIRTLQIPVPDRSKRIDWPGAVLVAMIIGSLVLGLESLRHVDGGILNLRGILFFCATIASTVLLVASERHRRDPIVDVGFVASRAVAPLLVVSFLVGYALLAGVIFVPLYAQVVFGATTLGSGAILNAAAAGLAIASYLAGHYTNALGPRRLTVAGMATASAGLAVMILLRQDVGGVLAGLMLLGAGLGLSQGPLSFLGLSVAPQDKHGQVSGLIAITRSMGGAAGITMAGVLLTRAIRQFGGGEQADVDIEPAEIWDSGDSLDALGSLSEAARETVIAAVGSGLVQGWYWALGAAVIGTVVALLLRERNSMGDSNHAGDPGR